MDRNNRAAVIVSYFKLLLPGVGALVREDLSTHVLLIDLQVSSELSLTCETVLEQEVLAHKLRQFAEDFKRKLIEDLGLQEEIDKRVSAEVNKSVEQSRQAWHKQGMLDAIEAFGKGQSSASDPAGD